MRMGGGACVRACACVCVCVCDTVCVLHGGYILGWYDWNPPPPPMLPCGGNEPEDKQRLAWNFMHWESVRAYIRLAWSFVIVNLNIYGCKYVIRRRVLSISLWLGCALWHIDQLELDRGQRQEDQSDRDLDFGHLQRHDHECLAYTQASLVISLCRWIKGTRSPSHLDPPLAGWVTKWQHTQKPRRGVWQWPAASYGLHSRKSYPSSFKHFGAQWNDVVWWTRFRLVLCVCVCLCVCARTRTLGHIQTSSTNSTPPLSLKIAFNMHAHTSLLAAEFSANKLTQFLH